MNPDFNAQLIKCLSKDNDDLLIASQNAAWQKIASFYKDSPALRAAGSTQYWGDCPAGSERCPVGPYLRSTPSQFGRDNIEIMEPCNYVSNVAFYQTAMESCDYDWQTLSIYQQQ
jgi:hypothetical protein